MEIKKYAKKILKKILKKRFNTKVSVIIPVYNSAKYLEECMNSLLSQTLKEIEIIAVNDGSKDNSLEILKSIRKRDKRVRIINQKNQGAGAARNNGMKRARGKYLAFLDSDDFFEPDMLEASYGACVWHDADLCVFRSNLYDNEKKTFTPYTWFFNGEYFPLGVPFNPKTEDYGFHIFQMFNGWPWDKLYKRSFIEENKLQFQNLKSSNDLYFVFMALGVADKIITVDKTLANQRVGLSSSISNNRKWNCYYEASLALKEGLVARGLFDRYRQSFVNWVTEFIIWQLTTMTGENQKKAYDLFVSKGLSNFDIEGKDKDYFYNPIIYDRLQRILSDEFIKENGLD